MDQLGIITRTAVVVGLVGIAASALAPQDAAAFGGLRGFGGGARIGGGFHGFGGGFHPAFGRGGPIGRPFPIRLPGPRLPPIGLHPGHPVLWPPIGRHPGPRLPPIVRLPPRILPPPVIIGRPRLPIVPVATAAVGIGAVQTAAPICTTGGTFVAITFVPTATAADITNFLGSYSVTVADGPNTAGVYRIRLSDGALPSDKVASFIASMRNQTAIVASIAGA